MTTKLNILCKYDRLVPISSIKPNPDNPNTHSKEQIERLAKGIAKFGVRLAIVVSKQSDMIAKGHGTFEALKLLGQTEVPIVWQNFESYDEEYAWVVFDNAIQEWSELNLSKINEKVGDLGPDFDVELLGLKNFEIEPFDNESLNTDEVVEEKYTIKIHFQDKEEANDVFKELRGRGMIAELV